MVAFGRLTGIANELSNCQPLETIRLSGDIKKPFVCSIATSSIRTLAKTRLMLLKISNCNSAHA